MYCIERSGGNPEHLLESKPASQQDIQIPLMTLSPRATRPVREDENCELWRVVARRTCAMNSVVSCWRRLRA
jgi:hypothetical protein